MNLQGCVYSYYHYFTESVLFNGQKDGGKINLVEVPHPSPWATYDKQRLLLEPKID